MATVGLYGSTASSTVASPSGSESVGLYGNNTVFGGSYFEWFIFYVSDTLPETPTGGTWDFTTNTGTPPTGWLASPPQNPLNTVWVSIGLVNSKSSVAIVWSAPGKFSFSSGLPILSGTATPLSGDGQTDQIYIQTSTAPETIWFKQAGTWTRLTGSTLYADLTSNQTLTGTKTFSSPIAGSVTGTSANITGILAVANGGTGSTSANNAFNALAPSQTGNSGKYLTTDGSNSSWAINSLGTVTSVAVSGGTTGLTTSGSPITTSGTITLAGTLAVANGGTGQTTANAAFNALAPSQATNSGKYLTTDGTNTSWAVNPLGTVTSVAATAPAFLSITGSPITTSGTLAIGLSGTALPTANGGTGLTSFTANGVVYASSTSALATGSALTFDGANLGIGTSSPTYRLDTQFSSSTAYSSSNTLTASPIAWFYNTNASAGVAATIRLDGGVGGGNAVTTISAVSEGGGGSALTFGTRLNSGGNCIEQVRIDSSGNLGLKVTPSAWASFIKTLEIANGGALAFAGPFGIVGSTNGYYNGTNWIYKTTGAAAEYLQTAGQHQWFNAPSGTAGDAITFTQALTLDTSGVLLVGLTSATGVAKLQVSGALKTTGFTVSTLPAGSVGMRTYVTDALAPTFGATVVAGGAVTIPVFYNGSNWIVC